MTTAIRLVWSIGVAGLVVGSLLHRDSVPIRMLQEMRVSHAVLHVSAYAALAFLPAAIERRTTAVLAAFSLIGLGISLEFGQLLCTDRSFEISDMVANSAGVLVGYACAELGWRRVKLFQFTRTSQQR